jgi:2'-5' RNA ligase
LSQEDLALLNQAYSENWTRYNQGVLGIGNNLPAQQRLMALQRLEAQFNEGFGQTVNSTLTNPELSQRFNQLNMQFQNFGAFNDPVVREQLNLTPQQQRQIRRMSNEWRQQLRRLRRAGNDIDPQMADQQFNEGFGQTVNSTLTNPELSQRFNQLNMQFQNFGAFNDPMVREQLNLTPQQQRQIRRMSNEWRQQLRRLRRAGNDIDPQMADQQFNVMQEQYQAQLGQVLTPEQQQTWTGLIGERYSFPRTSYVPPNEDMRNENQQRRVIPHGGIDNGTAQDQTIRRNVTPHNDGTAGTTQQNQGVRRNVTPHGGRQSAQRQSGNSVR